VEKVTVTMVGLLYLCAFIPIAALLYLSTVDLRLIGNQKSVPSTASVVRFYNLFGGVLMNDFYHHTFEEKAMDVMVQHCGFNSRQDIVEIGPGSGFLAAKLLSQIEKEEGDERGPTYVGVDMSKTMFDKASGRLNSYIKKGSVQIVLVNDTFAFIESLEPVIDRFVFTYVLDLLPHSEIIRFAEALKSKLRPNSGKVCIVNLTYGFNPFSRVVTNIWQLIYTTFGGASVGGCRPLNSLIYFHVGNGYNVEHVTRVESSGLPSEVVVLSRLLQ
jgi:phospholipid N-methyltransferase